MTNARSIRGYISISFFDQVPRFICLKVVKGTCLTVILSCQQKPQQNALTDIFITLLYVISFKFQAWSDKNHWGFIRSGTSVSLEVWIGHYWIHVAGGNYRTKWTKAHSDCPEM